MVKERPIMIIKSTCCNTIIFTSFGEIGVILLKMYRGVEKCIHEQPDRMVLSQFLEANSKF